MVIKSKTKIGFLTQRRLALRRESVKTTEFTAVLSLLFLVILAAIAGAYFDLATGSMSTCNAQLSASVDSPPSICLTTIAIKYSDPNSSSADVPALVMAPGSAASISILYEPHADLGDQYNPQSNLSTFNIPTAVSAVTGEPNLTAVHFSKGKELYKHGSWVIYTYNISTSNDSNGYYAIIVPFGPQLYPALVVSSDTGSVNASMMTLWGYVGSITTGETAIPSIFVATSGLTLVNVTISLYDQCQSRACNLISSSEYYEG